jgi:hypothetical protein
MGAVSTPLGMKSRFTKSLPIDDNDDDDVYLEYLQWNRVLYKLLLSTCPT